MLVTASNTIEAACPCRHGCQPGRPQSRTCLGEARALALGKRQARKPMASGTVRMSLNRMAASERKQVERLQRHLGVIHVGGQPMKPGARAWPCISGGGSPPGASATGGVVGWPVAGRRAGRCRWSGGEAHPRLSPSLPGGLGQPRAFSRWCSTRVHLSCTIRLAARARSQAAHHGVRPVAQYRPRAPMAMASSAGPVPRRSGENVHLSICSCRAASVSDASSARPGFPWPGFTSTIR